MPVDCKALLWISIKNTVLPHNSFSPRFFFYIRWLFFFHCCIFLSLFQWFLGSKNNIQVNSVHKLSDVELNCLCVCRCFCYLFFSLLENRTRMVVIVTRILWHNCLNVYRKTHNEERKLCSRRHENTNTHNNFQIHAYW